MIWFGLYVASIVGANWALATIGVVPVGFGLMAPAGVYFAGAVYTFRDLTQVALGKRWALVAIFLGAAISLLTSRQFALASLAAFLLGELLDMLIFSRLRQQGRILEAFAAGNTVGVALDSLVFLSAAFGSVALFPGLFVGKSWITLLTLLLTYRWRKSMVPARAAPASA
ncbi:MAG: VUT family protein [Chloroflexota bacterium]